MDLGVILVLLALLLGVGLYLVAPLIRHSAPHVAHETQEVSSLMAERDRVITALQELDLDFKLGKIPEEDYPAQRTDLLQKGAGVLKQLETLGPSPVSGEQDAGTQAQDAETQLERLAANPTESLTDDKIEAMLAARRKARKTKAAGFCPRCGKPVMLTDQFCPNCGKALN